MIKFLKELISATGESSSKRFAALFTLANLIAITWVATIEADHFVTPEFMYDSLAVITASGLGLTVIEKIFVKKADNQTSDTQTTDQSK